MQRITPEVLSVGPDGLVLRPWTAEDLESVLEIGSPHAVGSPYNGSVGAG